MRIPSTNNTHDIVTIVDTCEYCGVGLLTFEVRGDFGFQNGNG